MTRRSRRSTARNGTRERLQARPLLGKGFRDDAPRGAMQAHVGDRGEPAAELGVQILEIAEATGEEEVLAHVAERPLHLSFGLGPVGPAGARQEAIVGGQRHEGAVVDDVAVLALAGHRGLHAVVEDLAGHAAQGREGGDVAAQDRLQVLVQDEACPDVARVAQHHREQPDDAGHTRLVGKRDLEAGEVDLSLLAGRGLEADLEGSG